MKRSVSLFLSLVMLLALVGCGSSADSGNAKSADLTAFCEEVLAGQEAAMDTVPQDSLEVFYPGLSEIETTQCVAATAMMSAVAAEILLVEVANAEDVAAVEQIMNDRVSYQVGDGTSPGGAWYPDTIEQWELNSRVVTVGNSVMLAVFSNVDDVTASFEALFA